MADKQRIAFLCHPYHRGGVTRWMADAAVFAAKSGSEVYFVTVQPATEFHSSGGRETMLELMVPHSGYVHVISSKVGFVFEFGTGEYRATTYARLLCAHVPAGTPVIVSDDLAVWSAAASVADVYPMVGVLHGDQDYYYSKASQYHSQLSLCVCVSGRIRRNVLEKVMGLNRDKVHTIPCGVILSPFVPATSETRVARLIFVGRLTDYEKRAYDLVGICAALHKRGFPFHLNIVGSSDASAVEFISSFSEKGIEDVVSFHGWRPAAEVQRLLCDADILLLTSNSEGMPLVMMEALAAGCGFAGTRVSGVEDYEHDERAADCVAVFTIGDIDDAANKIIRLAAVPVGRRTLAARRLAGAEFSMQVCVDKYFDAIAAVPVGSIVPVKIKFSFVDALYSKLIAIARHISVSLRK